MQTIRTITLPKRNNCYLVEGDAGFVLIDTGYPHRRAALRQALEDAGCRPGNLALIVLTHGDIDHSGNAAYLRDGYGARIAMHPGDTAMCLTDGETRERNNRPPRDFPKILYLWLVVGLSAYLVRKAFRRVRFEPFAPDLLLEDGQDLRPLGLDATAYHTPGHSKGSISLFTPEGALFCGDHFGQIWGHVIGSEDDPAFPSTNDKLARLKVKTVYPGHGEPFAAERAGLWAKPAAKTVQIDPAAAGYVPVLNGPPETVTMRSGSVVLLPSENVGKHSTGGHEEVLVVLAGEGELRTSGGTVLELRPNVVAYCPPETEHDVVNTGSGPLRYVFVVAKAPPWTSRVLALTRSRETETGTGRKRNREKAS